MLQHFELALIGAAPALLAMWSFDLLDEKRPEPRHTLRMVSLGGMLAAVPIMMLAQLLASVGPSSLSGGPAGLPTSYLGAAYLAFVIAAVPEELAKIGSVYLFAWRRPEFDERMDGIAYGARAGLGFALVENVAYLLTLPNDLREYVVLLLARAVLVVPGHAIWGGISGYFWARRRFDGRGPGLWGGLALAVGMHGFYDLWVFGCPVAMAHGHAWMGLTVGSLPVLVYVVPMVLVLGGAWWLRRLAKLAVALDDMAEAEGRLSSLHSMAVVLPDDPAYTAEESLAAGVVLRPDAIDWPASDGSSESLPL